MLALSGIIIQSLAGHDFTGLCSCWAEKAAWEAKWRTCFHLAPTRGRRSSLVDRCLDEEAAPPWPSPWSLKRNGCPPSVWWLTSNAMQRTQARTYLKQRNSCVQRNGPRQRGVDSGHELSMTPAHITNTIVMFIPSSDPCAIILRPPSISKLTGRSPQPGARTCPGLQTVKSPESLPALSARSALRLRGLSTPPAVGLSQ